MNDDMVSFKTWKLSHCFWALWNVLNLRSSHQRFSVRKGVFRNFAKFTGKHLFQSLYFNNVASLNFIKIEILAQVFSCDFCEISKKSFFTEPIWATASVNLKENCWVGKYFFQPYDFLSFFTKNLLTNVCG